MTDSRKLLQHFLAALAYRTQEALRGAPSEFADFRAGTHVRTPHELVWHMTHGPRQCGPGRAGSAGRMVAAGSAAAAAGRP